MRRRHPHRLLGVEGMEDRVALPLEHLAGRGKDVGLVVHQQNRFHKMASARCGRAEFPAGRPARARRGHLSNASSLSIYEWAPPIPLTEPVALAQSLKP